MLRPGAPLIIAVTRPGLLGFWLESRWGNSCLAPNTLVKMMKTVGLTDIYLCPFTFGLSRCTSIVCVGIKSEARNNFETYSNPK